jgi:DNA-binding LytR/AlgR family response regulator
MINCIIVDDEPLAREGLTDYVKQVDFLRLAGTAEDPVKLASLMDRSSVDLLFLDIKMPRMSGIDFLRNTRIVPMVILTTAYPTYALEGYQLSVLDYLLKPITFERFFQSTQKAKDYFQLLNRQAANEQDAIVIDPAYFFIKCGSQYEKIILSEILFIEGLQNYVTIYTVRGKYISLLVLKNLQEKLGDELFIRVHKSYIVAIDKITSISSSEIVIGEYKIPVSRNYREEVIRQIVNAKRLDG